MGRTQHTYRMRLKKIRDRLISEMNNDGLKQKYSNLWIIAHTLSAPSSTLPHPDTHAIATFSILLEAIHRIEELKDKLNIDR